MLLSKTNFFVVGKFYCFYTVHTGALRKNKKFIQKNSNSGLFGGANSIFLKVDFCWWIKPKKKPVGFNRTGLFMPTLVRQG